MYGILKRLLLEKQDPPSGKHHPYLYASTSAGGDITISYTKYFTSSGIDSIAPQSPPRIGLETLLSTELLQIIAEKTPHAVVFLAAANRRQTVHDGVTGLVEHGMYSLSDYTLGTVVV